VLATAAGLSGDHAPRCQEQNGCLALAGTVCPGGRAARQDQALAGQVLRPGWPNGSCP
jgi:hypothetical protein